jgi:hypothetical protein
MTPLRMADSAGPVHTPRTAPSPQRAASSAVVHTINTPYDGDPLLDESSSSNVKQATT